MIEIRVETFMAAHADAASGCGGGPCPAAATATAAIVAERIPIVLYCRVCVGKRADGSATLESSGERTLGTRRERDRARTKQQLVAIVTEYVVS